MTDQHQGPRQAELRKGRVSLVHQAYFITKCTDPEVCDYLIRPDVCEVLVDCLHWARDNGWWRMTGFVVMPGHYHMALGLGEKKTLSEAVAGVDKFVSRRVNQLLGRTGPFWEHGYYDHAIRDRRDFDAILDYIHLNPVTSGLVSNAESWPFSTAHPKYAKEIDWDWLGATLAPSVATEHRFAADQIPPRYR